MKITVNTGELKAAVSTVIPAIASRTDGTYTRAYEFILLNATESVLTLTACNLSMQIETECAAVIEEDGLLLVPGKLFDDIISKLAPESITTIESVNESAHIKSGSLDMKLQTLPASEFEGIHVLNVDTEFKIKENTLRYMLMRTTPFALQDNSRPMLDGVFFELNGEFLNVVALDSLKLAKRTERIEKVTGSDDSLTVNSKMLASIASRVLTDSENVINVMFSRQNLIINAGKTSIIARRMDGAFIKYAGIIPKSYDTRVRLNRKDFISIIDRAYLVARDDRRNVVKMDFNSTELTVSVNNEVGNMTDSMSILLTGSDINIAFNAKLILDVIKNVDDDELCIEMPLKTGPCVVCPIEGDSFLYLLMPIDK